jgi:hypothetical protein
MTNKIFKIGNTFLKKSNKERDNIKTNLKNNDKYHSSNDEGSLLLIIILFIISTFLFLILYFLR